MSKLFLALGATALAAGLLGAQVATSSGQPGATDLKSLGMIIYAAKGQPADQQAKDEAACTEWAESQTGIKISGGQVNTEAAAKAAGDQAAQATQGAAVSGAARGAAGGAMIGAISGDAGEGAAIGAVAGAIGGRRAKKRAEAQAEQQGAQAAVAQNQAAIDHFKKAAAVCLQGRGYTVS